MSINIRHIIQHPFFKNTAKLSASNIFMYVLPIIVTPVLSRLFTLSEYGEWGIFSSWFSILSIGLFLGFENYIVKAKEYELPKMIYLCLLVSIGMCLLFAGIYHVAAFSGASLFDNIPYPGFLLILLIIYAFQTVLSNICNRMEMYNVLSISSMTQGISQAGLRIWLGISRWFAVNGLILGITGAYTITVAFLFANVIRTKVKIQHHTNKHIKWKTLIGRYKNAPLYDAPSSVLSFAAFNLPIIILAQFYDKSEVGCFSIILQLLLLPMSFIGSAIGRVYYQQLCKQLGNKEIIRATTHQVLKFLTLISIIPLMFIVCGGDRVIVWFLGAKWHAAGNLALCLALWSFPIILTQPLLPIFRVLNRQRTLLVYDLCYFVGCIGTIFAGGLMAYNMYHVLLVFSIVCLVVKFSLFLHILRLSNLQLSSYKYMIPVWLLLLSVWSIRVFTV